LLQLDVSIPVLAFEECEILFVYVTPARSFAILNRTLNRVELKFNRRTRTTTKMQNASACRERGASQTKIKREQGNNAEGNGRVAR
jgi:hypothetical protein